ncbi:hypothetical protein B7R54_10725 [Subtercola boreus]|uniref:DUF2029 domain-containing protein n=1 Tax=Subtercola boreus TaxID=120213 RepID=A0A3E0VJ08_9MICO|nr:glycosyltransferase 87 family protein [Subtercola boreus]RFA09639.1 hypothetical protein B7R54_10725 [Subtercola boreus]TQL53282.1 uncharacterized protein DUF2029 [Subtercola boreus]
MRRLVTNPLLIWLAFAAIHLWLGYVGLTAPTLPWGDVTVVYNTWIHNGLAGYWVGIDGPWVYPLLALAPMIAAMALGGSLYGTTWFLLVVIANGAVLAFILNSRATKVAPEAEPAQTALPNGTPAPDARPTGFSPNIRFVAAWWWLAALLLLGPVALGRIDTFEVALVIVGLLLAIRRPAVAGVLLAAATWVKVWPIAMVVAVMIATKRRWTVAIAAAATAAVIAGVGLALGAGANLFSFVTQQTGRGLQIEAPISTPFMWGAYLRLPGSVVYYDQDILTFQVKGAGGPIADVLTTPLLALAVLAILLIGVWVVRSGASVTEVLPPLALALVSALIVFNKVGSPQFMLWLTAPVILGIIWQGKRFRTFAIIAAVLALLTQIIYPYYYDWLISLNTFMLVTLSLRNLLVCVLFVLALRALVKTRVKPARVSVPRAVKVVT